MEPHAMWLYMDLVAGCGFLFAKKEYVDILNIIYIVFLVMKPLNKTDDECLENIKTDGELITGILDDIRCIFTQKDVSDELLDTEQAITDRLYSLFVTGLSPKDREFLIKISKYYALKAKKATFSEATYISQMDIIRKKMAILYLE
jgi:hypothetical protein